MKKLLLALALFVALGLPTMAQPGAQLNFSRIDKEHVAIRTNSKQMVSWYTFYTHVNQNLSTYLVGSEDLSLFRNSFFIDQSNKQFNLGITLNKSDFKAKSKRGLPDLQNQKGIYRAGLYLPYPDDFGSIYKKEKLVENTGFDLKASYIFDRSIDIGKKQDLSKMMMMELQSLKASYQKEYTELLDTQKKAQDLLNKLNNIKKGQSIDGLRNDLKGILPQTEHGFIDQNNWKDDKLLQAYIDAQKLTVKKLNAQVKRKKSTSLIDSTIITAYSQKELEILNTYRYHSYTRLSWFSANAKLPLGNTSKIISVDSSTLTGTRRQWPIEISASLNTALERKKVRYFGSLSYHFKNTNTAAVSGFMTEAQLFNIPFATSQKTGLNDEQTVYIGEYAPLLTQSLSLDLTLMRKDYKSIANHEKHIVNYGLHFNAEHFHNSKYTPINLSFGLPVSLLDKDGEPTVNFEILTLLTDIRNDLPANKKAPKTTKEMINFGFKVGLPLGRPTFK